MTIHSWHHDWIYMILATTLIALIHGCHGEHLCKRDEAQEGKYHEYYAVTIPKTMSLTGPGKDS